MKKIFTLMAAAMLTLTASAQKQAIDLTGRNLVFYTTYGDIDIANEENTFTGADITDPLNALGLGYKNDGSGNSLGVVYQRNNYTDPETGFTIPRSAYRPMALYNGTADFVGQVAMSETDIRNIIGFKNIKKVILYMVGWGGNGNNKWRDMPSGVRWQAQYVNENGEATSTLCYAESAVGKEYIDELASDVMNNSYLNSAYDPTNANLMAYDQPFKLVVDLTNNGVFDADGNYELPFESATKTGEYAKTALDNKTEQTINYFFAKIGTACAASLGDPHNTSGNGSASGYDVCSGKWGERMPWTKDTIVKLQLKRNAAVVGFAFVSGDDNATNYYTDATMVVEGGMTTEPNQAYVDVEAAFPEWVGEAKIDGIKNVSLNAAGIVTYNLAGQKVSSNYKGIVIENGVKVIK